MTPLASKLEPSPFPYQFTELINFRGDFDQTIQPGEVVNPKGLAYHPQLDRLLVSLSPFNGAADARTQILNAVDREGRRQRFAPAYQMFRRVESKLAVVPPAGPPVEMAGFNPGEVFVGRGPTTQLSRLSASGEVLADVFAEFGEGGGLWGALAFDTEGAFGGRLIAISSDGAIYLVNGAGESTFLTNLQMRLEGAAVAPATFGPLAKQLIVGVEGYGDTDSHGGEIYAVNTDGQATLLANIGYAAESLAFIPPRGGTYYQNELSFERERENRVMVVSMSQWLNRVGGLLAVNELTGELHELAWNGAQYVQQPAGTVPGRWSSAGFYVQGTELEAGCFAVNEPVLPGWGNWSAVPGELRTDRAPSASADIFGDLFVFTSNLSGRGVFSNRLRQKNPDWDGWDEADPPDSASPIRTPHALAAALHNAQLYAFAVLSDGRIQQRPITGAGSAFTEQPWIDVPGGMLTNTAVASAVVNGRLILCALGQDQGLYLNELAPGGRYWSGWYQIPGGGRSDMTPCVATFQDELYIFIKGLTSRRILVKARSADGVWTPWAEVPGAGRTDAPISALAASGQLYVFIKQPETRAPFVNVASVTGTWSGWLPLPNGGVTDTALASTTVGNQVFLFAKGIDDRRVYVRSTM